MRPFSCADRPVQMKYAADAAQGARREDDSSLLDLFISVQVVLYERVLREDSS